MHAAALFPRVVERSRIVLLAAEGKQDKQIARSLSMTPKKASRWRKRFLRLGLQENWITRSTENEESF